MYYADKSIYTTYKFFSRLLLVQAPQNNDKNLPQMNQQEVIRAVQKNDTPTILKSIEQGLNVNLTDEQDRSLLLISTSLQFDAMAMILVNNGADVNQQAQNQDTPFLLAGATGQTALVKLFFNHGARFDIFNRYHGTALIPACERGHIETVKLLANTPGFPIDHVNRLGWTGLMEAVILGDGSKKFQEIVQILKDAGADMHIPDHDGVTPLQHAKNRDYKEIADIIRS